MGRDHAAQSYADLACFYDWFTADHDHEDWAHALETAAVTHGLRGKRMLEAACGTGNLLRPFLARGYEATGCDLTPEMLELARPKVGHEAALFVADVRSLPAIGPFDLVLCVGDVFNYFLEPADVARALTSLRRVLQPDGLALFDANTLGAYRSVFAVDRCIEDQRGVLTWRGLSRPDAASGCYAEAVVDAFTAENGHFNRATSRHRHRHYPDAELASAIAHAGLRALAVYGVTPDGVLHEEFDELAHNKRLYVVSPLRSATRKGGGRASDQEARVTGGSRRCLHEGQLGGAPSPDAGASGEGEPLSPPVTGNARALPRLPRLKPTVDVFPAPNGDIHLYRGADDDFVIESGGEATRAFLGKLDGETPVAALATSLSEDPDHGGVAGVHASVAQLLDLGVVDDAADDATLSSYDRERYDRQLRYLGDAAPPGASRAAYQSKLHESSVAILGVGGLGGAAALALTTLGLGRLLLVDGDVVELSNLNRQVLFCEADIGARKASAAAGRLREFNSNLRVEPIDAVLQGPDQIRALVDGVDLVVDAVDTPAHLIEHWVNEACFRSEIPYIAMSQFPPRVRIGPLFVPGVTGCYACQEATWRKEFPLFDALAAHRSGQPPAAAALGPTSLLIGAQVAMDVMHHLTGLRAPKSLGKAVMLNVCSMQVDVVPVLHAPECAVCGSAAAA
jgi:bacteriocin biosynthesis cyclodehydratase domain-containing protein